MPQNSNGHIEARRTCFLSFEKQQQQVDLDGPLVLSTSGDFAVLLRTPWLDTRSETG